jgi:hypothetical protein
MAKKELEDPVEAGREALAEDEEFNTLDISKIDVSALPDEAARVTMPFDGYPLKKVKMEVKEKGKMVKKDFILSYFVLHNHVADPVRQDPSNRKIKTDAGMVQVRSYHGRSIPDVLNGNNSNVMVQFSTPIKTATGEFYGHYVPDHYVRAQLAFKYDAKTKRVMVDKRYILLDREQAGRLKQCFQQIINPKIQMEKAADYVSGLSSDEPAAMAEKDYGQT